MVRYRSGLVRYFLFDGTSDVVWPALFDTSEEAWADYGKTWPGEFDLTLAEPVEIHSDYGGGDWWEGQANDRFILPPYDWFEIREQTPVFDGVPGWARQPLNGSGTVGT